MRHLVVVASLLLASVTPARAQVSVSIGIDVPVFPQLVLVPGYPVYYAPQADANYFFYDGVYWVYREDSWYSSSWYNGPWYVVEPERVPLYVLRVPVQYYREPPPYFRGWRPDAPPRWGERWGREWEGHHPGWDRWNRGAGPRPAPLPVYQRQFAGDRYPRSPEQQRALGSGQYRYQPRESAARERLGPPGRPGGGLRFEPGRPAPFEQRQAGPPGRQRGPGPGPRMGEPGPRHDGGPFGPQRMGEPGPRHDGQPYGPPRAGEPGPRHDGRQYGPPRNEGPPQYDGHPRGPGPRAGEPPPQGRGQEQRGGERGQGERHEDERRGHDR